PSRLNGSATLALTSPSPSRHRANRKLTPCRIAIRRSSAMTIGADVGIATVVVVDAAAFVRFHACAVRAALAAGAVAVVAAGGAVGRGWAAALFVAADQPAVADLFLRERTASALLAQKKVATRHRR